MDFEGWYIISGQELSERAMKSDEAWAAMSRVVRFSEADIMCMTLVSPDDDYFVIAEKGGNN